MLSRIVLAAICCARAAGATGVAAAAVGPTEFTVYGSTTSHSLWFDRNQNGQPDPGDVLSTTGPLSNGQFQIGTWQAAVDFVNSSTLSVLGVFSFSGGTLLVAGSFDPNAGPPPALSVYQGHGRFLGLTGRLAVTDMGSGNNAFTFTLRCAPPDHDVHPSEQAGEGRGCGNR